MKRIFVILMVTDEIKSTILVESAWSSEERALEHLTVMQKQSFDAGGRAFYRLQAVYLSE